MRNKLFAGLLVTFASSLAVAQSPQLLPPEGQPLLLTGTVRLGNGKYAHGNYTVIELDRASRSPCNGKTVRDILLWNADVGDPMLLARFVDQRIVVRGTINCPNSGIQFSADPSQAFRVY